MIKAEPLSILVVNWKSKEYVRRCLHTIHATCKDLNPQIVIVDGGSFDGCGKMLEAEFPRVEFVQSPDNRGFGRSNNLGFEKVTGDYVLLLNPDTELKPGALQKLLGEIVGKPDTGLVGPKLLNSDGTLQTSCVQSLPTPWNQAVDSEGLRRFLPNSRLWGVGQAFQAKEPTEVEAISGACMLLKAETFRRIGGFSAEFFMYGEDMDLCAKVHRLGLKVLHVPSSEVIHHGGGSSKTQVSQFSTVMMRVSGQTYMRLNYGRTKAFLYRFLQAISATVRLIILIPACLLSAGPRRCSSKTSLQKWWYVLRWSLGFSPIRF